MFCGLGFKLKVTAICECELGLSHFDLGEFSAGSRYLRQYKSDFLVPLPSSTTVRKTGPEASTMDDPDKIPKKRKAKFARVHFKDKGLSKNEALQTVPSKLVMDHNSDDDEDFYDVGYKMRNGVIVYKVAQVLEVGESIEELAQVTKRCPLKVVKRISLVEVDIRKRAEMNAAKITETEHPNTNCNRVEAKAEDDEDYVGEKEVSEDNCSELEIEEDIGAESDTSASCHGSPTKGQKKDDVEEVTTISAPLVS
ncbi:hypothetical protein QAD02_003189 [Eretmocerus hayati]|uniref:Uncharacterized protein n=1 Tax=Eretmocerus hayati TaxID=131215 RepID=A0ACC2NL71_9HYME|nr:hypothetical protein QAD02_003189 [Eretmocerus hayati]